VRIPGEDDVVSDARLLHPRADGGNRACCLVARDDRHGRSELSRNDFEIGVTETRGTDAHQDLPRCQRPDLHRFQRQGAARISKDGCTEAHLGGTL
jgi:hypothetical protein